MILPIEAEIKLLSQKEIEYLRFPENFSIDYSYVLKHKIKSKVKALNDELVLLERAGLIEFSKITEISKIEQSSKQGYFEERECGRRDLNPGSLAWKAKVLNQTRRQPRKISHILQRNLSLSGLKMR